MTLFWKVSLAALVVVGSFGAGWLYRAKSSQAVQWELVDAFPRWPAPCVEADALEAEIFNLAVMNLERVGEAEEGGRSIVWLELGAQKFLSSGIFRRDNKNSIPVCAPDRIYERAAEAITKYNGFHGRPTEDQLYLAAKFPVRSSYIVEKIANSAFNKLPQESERFRLRDIRPLARTILAGFGRQAEGYGSMAYEQLSAKDSMGTGAAQVAAAAGYPEALPRIQMLMMDILTSIPREEAILRQTRNRLYELSYAVYFAGEEGKNYTAPIKELMTRKVQSWAPPFGLLDVSPLRMCEVLRRIEGDNSIRGYDFCIDGRRSFEQ
jgi:hypothetical protein